MGWEGFLKPFAKTFRQNLPPHCFNLLKKKKCLKKAEKILCNFSPAPFNISQNLDENVKIIWCGLRSDFHCALNVQLMVIRSCRQ